MKKIIISIIFLISSVVTIQVKAGVMQSTFDNMAYIIFKAGWPTAKYVDYELFEVNSEKRFIVVKMNGISAFSDGPLHMKLKVFFNDSYGIKDVKVISQNAILSPPFKTLGALSEIIENSNSSNNYNIIVKNECSKSIKLAIHYKSENDEWVTRSWYNFTPHEKAALMGNNKRLTTTTAVMYYYAISTDGKTVWEGDEYTVSIDGKIKHMAKLVDKKGSTDLTLSCPNE